MAIIPCKECSHQVSDQAASCPSCGAPIASTLRPNPRARRFLRGLLVALVTFWVVGATIWVIGTLGLSHQVRVALTGSREAAERSGAPAAPSARTIADRPSSGAAPPRLVYQTTAMQLSRDYDANEVATQRKIGDSLVSIKGSVAEIDEDDAGRPVVKLQAGSDPSLSATLSSGQAAAAAQLVKGETVDIQCGEMQRVGLAPQGRDCVLLLVDATTSPGVFAPAPVAGAAPVPAVKAAAQERAARYRERNRERKRVGATTAVPALARTVPEPAPAPEPAPVTVPVVIPDDVTTVPRLSVADVPDIQTQQKAASAASLSAPSALLSDLSPGPDTSTVLDGSPADAATAATAATASTAAATHTAEASDGLAGVRATDPEAADHIASYCGQATASAPDRAAAAASCRHDEVAAWTRLVVQDEFPGLDDATRRKCREPPFPDSYVAMELCARYELHGD